MKTFPPCKSVPHRLPLRQLALVGALLFAGQHAAFSADASAGNTTNGTAAARIAQDGEKRFDFSVSDAPAAQAFALLASHTRYNVLVPQDISGSITLRLRDVTLQEALEAIRDTYGYDFRITGNRIQIQSNAVQTRVFRVNYLTGRRQGSSEVRVLSGSIAQAQMPAASGMPGAFGTGVAGIPTGAPGMPGAGTPGRADNSSRVTMTSDADFWRDTRIALETLIGVNGDNKDGRSVVINGDAGVIVVRGKPAEIRQVESYLQAVQLGIQRQVMIEAKIVEVSLSNESQSGINWAFFERDSSGRSRGGGVVSPGTTLNPVGGPIIGGGNVINSALGSWAVSASSIGRGFYGLAFQGANFAAVLNFLESQGGVQVLSSPRIATLNNQKAVLKVGTDEFFITNVSTNTTTSGNNTVTTPTISLQPFFSGIALDVTPQIDDEGNIILHVHPSISKVTERQKNVDLGTLGQFSLPLAVSSINETDSVVRLKNGQIVAIGGLMTQETRRDRNQVPALGDLPLLGHLFGQRSKAQSKREIVILMKPTVIGEDGAFPEGPSPES